MNGRELKFFEAVREAIELCMREDPRVYLLGLGVPDPKGVFATTLGLQEVFGEDRVLDMPTSENAMTGVALGSALVGRRPILVHQRMEFCSLAMEQVANQAAKWHYMFGGKTPVPLVIRMMIGQGWGQGAQHSQRLQAWFAHIPGLKVVMPTTAYDAKGLLISSIEDDNPVVFIEHRWLHNTFSEVPEGLYRVPLGEPRVALEGEDLTIVSCSYATLEALKAARALAEAGVRAEVVDIRTLAPLGVEPILESVRKTGRLLVTDIGWAHCGIAGEIVARVSEQALTALKAPPRRVCLPACPSPTTRALTRHYYPRAVHLFQQACGLLERKVPAPPGLDPDLLDVPDADFRGPF